MNESDFGTVPPSLLQLPAGQLVQTPTISQVHIQQYPECYHWHYTFFANKGYHLNNTVHPECDLASACTQVFITDLDELHQQLWLHIAKAQCQYQALSGFCPIQHLPSARPGSTT